MKNKELISVYILLIVLCMGCKCKEAVSPGEKLPPATQVGANTFGFLANGEVWLPKGFSGTKNPSWYYDPTYLNGNLSISCYSYLSEEDKQFFGIGGTNINKTGIYPIFTGSDAGISFTKILDSCSFLYYDTDNYRIGELNITRLDLTSGIISGTFWATLYDSTCKDTIKITEGRFDFHGN